MVPAEEAYNLYRRIWTERLKGGQKDKGDTPLEKNTQGKK
jgi:hypothetical protein